MKTNSVQFTLIKNNRGPIAKQISLTSKTPEAHIYEAQVRTEETDLLQFVQGLKRLPSDQALMTGIRDPKLPNRIVVAGQEDRITTIARTKDYFYPPTDGAILFKDVDAVQCPQLATDLYTTFNIKKLQTTDEVYAYLVQVAPELANAPMVIKPSSSSYLWNTETHTWHTQGKGFHIYIFLQHGHDTQRVSDIIDTRSFNQSGWLYVSKSGAVERRCLFDKKVCSPERIIFAAPPMCVSPLVSKAADFIKVYNAEAPLLNTLSSMILDASGNKIKNPGYFEKVSDKEFSAGELKFQKLRKLPEVIQAVNQYKKQHVEAVVHDIAKVANLSVTPELKEKVLYAIETHTLFGDFPLLLDRKTGEVELVENILNNKEYFHGRRIPQPFEPDYGNGQVAYLELKRPRPRIYSHGHGGGQSYYLVRQRESICINENQQVYSDIKTICEKKLSIEPDVFHIKRNEQTPILCQVVNDTLRYRETQAQLLNLLESKYNFVKIEVDKKTEEVAYKKTSCPDPLVMRLAGGDIQDYTQHLIAIQKYPIMTPNFELTKPGYNPDCKLYQLPNTEIEALIPELPTDSDLLKAYDTIWKPFSLFPFDSDLSRSTYLATLIGGIERPALIKQPGTFITSNQSGSGKTLLAECVRILSDSEYTGFIPATGEEELDKNFCSCIEADPKCVLIDNVCDGTVFKFNRLTSIMTAGEGGSIVRIFGTGRTINTANYRLQIMVTGNNIAIPKDQIRRFLSCRLCNEDTSTPYLLNYTFHPETVVRQTLPQIYASVLTILKAYALDTQQGRSFSLDTSAGSYDAWNELVRKPLCWLAQKFPHLNLLDPFLSIEANTESSEELLDLEQFLLAFESFYEGKAAFSSPNNLYVTSSQIWQDYTQYKEDLRTFYGNSNSQSQFHSRLGPSVPSTRLGEALESIYLSSVPYSTLANINLRGIGQVLNRYVDTPVTIVDGDNKYNLILKKKDRKRPYKFYVVRKPL